MLKRVVIIVLSIFAYIVNGGELTPDAVNEMVEAHARLMLQGLKIKEGSAHKFPVSAGKVLSAAPISSLSMDNLSIKPSYGNGINGFSILKNGEQKGFITIRIADSEQSAGLELGKWLVTSSMPLELLLKNYKRLADLGDVCVVSKDFDAASGHFMHKNSCLYLVRNGIIMQIRLFDKEVNVKKLAGMIDLQLVKTYDAVSREDKTRHAAGGSPAAGPFVWRQAAPSEDKTFIFAGGKKLIVREWFAADNYGHKYLSRLEIKGYRENNASPQKLWSQTWKNPFLSGTGNGIWQFGTAESRESRYFYLFLGTLKFPTATQMTIIEVDTGNNFKLTQSVFLINPQSSVSIVANTSDHDIIIKGKDRNEFFRFNRVTHMLSPLLTPWQLVYHALPFELAVLSKKPERSRDFHQVLLTINGTEIADPVNYFDALAGAGYWDSKDYFPLSESYKYYLMVMGLLEYQYLSSQIKALPARETEERIKRIISGSDFTMGKKAVLSDLPENIYLHRQKAAFALHYESQRRNISSIAISDDDAGSFYHHYKWAFRKDFTEPSGYYSFDEVKEFIYAEIKRLKSYGLEALVNDPPQMKIIWKKKEKTVIKRGLLE